MAKINVLGDAVVITSTVKATDYALIQKYRPEALTLCKTAANGEPGDPYFKVYVSNGNGSVNQYGIAFGGVARDGSGLATVTVPFTGPTDEAEVKEKVADLYGIALANLNQIEAAIPEVLTDIAARKAAVIEAITVA